MKIKSISNTVMPLSAKKASATQVNNFLEKDTKLVNRFKFLIIAETFLGINRLALIGASRFLIVLGHAYTVCMILSWTYYVLTTTSENTFVSVIKYSNYIELFITMFFAAFLQNKQLLSLTEKMFEIDKKLKITNEAKVMNEATLAKLLLQVSVTYCVLEFILFKVYSEEESPLFILLYISMLTQDCEQVIFCMLMRSIGKRLQIIKAHVVKTLSPEDTLEVTKKRSFSSAERLVNKTSLDVRTLLGLYESLHQCSHQVNNLMGIPMATMFFCSGLSTTLLLMSLIKLFQSTAVADMNLKLVGLYSIFRCVKYTGLVIFPCYYATEMKEHVQVIRKVLHEAINISELEFLERRKVKTFLQMTRDNGFTYALCGVITLNMSMPLSYISICTTYLVIIIQFSKFFD